jgi:hypothetical protein
MGRRWWAFGVAAVALVAMAGCGGGGGGGGEAAEPASTEPPVTVADPTTTVLSEEDAVLAAYQGYWDTWLAATNPPDPDHPDLAKFAVGVQLARDREAITNYRQLSQMVRLPENAAWSHEAAVASVNGDVAVITDCSIDDSVLLDRPSGRVLNDAVWSYALEATLVRESGTWRVDQLEVRSRWEGIAGCAA